MKTIIFTMIVITTLYPKVLTHGSAFNYTNSGTDWPGICGTVTHLYYLLQ